jgi:formylmethanofuran dehydrogenase subunit E
VLKQEPMENTPSQPDLAKLLELAAREHHQLCPRQVLGVRMGLWIGEQLRRELPQTDKRLLLIVETDGCLVDGLAAATGCRVGRRTLRIEDYGKAAATAVDTLTGQTVRVAPRPACREQALAYAPEARSRWEAQLLGYQRMPAAQLLSCETVQLTSDLAELLSTPGQRAVCEMCGEEIMNGREVQLAGRRLCRACAGPAYYLRPVLVDN